MQLALIWLVLVGSQFAIGRDSNIDRSCGNEKLDCVCNIPEAIRGLTLYVGLYKGDRLEEKIKGYKCEKLERLPESLVIEATGNADLFESSDEGANDQNGISYFEFNDRRRYKRRKRRYVQLGVPTNEAFQQSIAHIDPNALHQYIILGASVKFQCDGPDDYGTSSDGSKVIWTHYNGEPITAPQAAVDYLDGTLTIPAVQLSDIGIYNCTKKSGGSDEVVVIAHQLSVISEPIFWLKSSTNFETATCKTEEVQLIRDQVATWIHSRVCAECEVYDVSVSCSKQSSIPSYKIRAVVSAVGLSLQTEKSELRHSDTCRISCLEILHSKIMEIVRDSLVKLFKLPIEMRGSENRKLIHNSMYDTLQLELLLGCLAGFQFNEKLCFPCIPGYFSKEGTDCIPCDIGFYQPNLAATSCVPCPLGSKTVETGSISESQCHTEGLLDTAAYISAFYSSYKIFLIVSGIVLFTTIIVTMSICLCCPETTVGRSVRNCCCCYCAESPRMGYQKLDQEAELLTSKSMRSKKDRRQSRGILKSKPGNIPAPPPLPKDMIIRQKRKASGSKRGEDSRLSKTGGESENRYIKDEILDTTYAEGLQEEDMETTEESSLSEDGAHQLDSFGFRHKALAEEVESDSEEMMLEEDSSETIEVQDAPGKFSSVVDELKYRFSLQKPIGATSSSSEEDENSKDLELISPSERDKDNGLDETHSQSELDNDDSDDDGSIDTQACRSHECCKETPLRALIELHEASQRAASTNSSSPPDDSEADESSQSSYSSEVSSEHNSYISGPPPKPPPLILSLNT